MILEFRHSRNSRGREKQGMRFCVSRRHRHVSGSNFGQGRFGTRSLARLGRCRLQYISPSESCRTAEELHKRKIEFLAAACSGSKAGAETGTLTFMVGGEKNVSERLRPFFQSMGKTLYYCGTQGTGLRAKLTQNLIWEICCKHSTKTWA